MRRKRMTDRAVVRLALMDAIAWQESLADAHDSNSPEGKEAAATAQRYRAVLQRRYGDSRTIAEKALEGATYITLDELRARYKAGGSE